MSSEKFLFWGSGSIPCWKPMIVLKEKGLTFDDKLLSFGQKQHKEEEVTKLNPRGQLPTFRDGDVIVNESGAICDYLEFKYADQGTCLLPKDAGERAQVLQRVFEQQNLIKKLMENIVYYIFTTPKDKFDKTYLDGKKEEARNELKIWEEYLSKQGAGTYVVGKNFTMADVYVFPVIAFGVRGQLDLSKFPALKAYYEMVKERPSIKATWPPHWIEDPATKEFFVGV